MSKAKEKSKILFLCTGNSCRSQMAEGWAKHLKADVIEAYSAGVSPVGLSPRGTKVMAEAGIDISSHRSKSVDEFSTVDFDYVITLCDNAAKNCPTFPGKAKVIHKPFEDPYFVSGNEEQIFSAYRKIRDQIRAFIETIPESLD